MSQLVLVSDTLITTPAAGNLEYNGQFFGTDSNASRAQLQRIVRATDVASTSGTSIDFTALPAWIERITVMFTGVSTSSTSNLIVQLGSSSFTTSGYTGYVARFGSSTAYLAYSSGFLLSETVQAASTIVGHLTITNITSNTWVGSGISTSASAINFTSSTAGTIALGGTLDRVRITTVNGTDTFDAGTINIIYEG